MYIFETMLDNLGLPKGEKWTTPAHRVVASRALLCNPRITSCQLLMDNVKIINKIPKEKIKKVTHVDLYKLGVMVL